MERKIKNGVVNDYQLALLSKSIFDIGPRTRFLFLMFGAIGIALAFMESLVGRQPQTIPLDKIIHFSGYFILSVTFVLALRPRWIVLSLVGLVAIGVAIEFLQRHTGRQFDVTDMVADAIGVVAGGIAGLAIRGIYAYIHKELAARRAHKRLFHFSPGEVLIREGDPIHEMYIVKSGQVRVLREANGREVPLGTLGAGEVLGVLGVVENRPQYATLVAVEPTTVYQMGLAELMESAGGSELPASLVLASLAKKVRLLADQLAQSGRSLPTDSTIA
jgi:hypothetical protein